jgi:nucleoid DNA-binding protein
MAKITNFNRKNFERYVSRKLKHISITHIRSVINILFEEMLFDLRNNKGIIIGNFGKLLLKQLPDRRHLNVKSNELVLSLGKKTLRFHLNKKLSRFLTNKLDIDKSL